MGTHFYSNINYIVYVVRVPTSLNISCYLAVTVYCLFFHVCLFFVGLGFSFTFFFSGLICISLILSATGCEQAHKHNEKENICISLSWSLHAGEELNSAV